MSPPFRKKVKIEDAYKLGAKESAVLILLYEKDAETYLVLTERTIYDGKHSGQISLPGGKKDFTDINIEHTALRETYEEIGIHSNTIVVLGELSHLYIPVSNFIVFPFVAKLIGVPSFIKEEKEVNQILEVNLNELLNEKNVGEKEFYYKESDIRFNAPTYNVNGVVVWGATAMILSEFLEIVKK
jgi:8-oxo-dGTP pyrophosphatase MutT (NUDIX family)